MEKKPANIWKILSAILAIICILCILWMVRYIINMRSADKALEQLKQQQLQTTIDQQTQENQDSLADSPEDTQGADTDLNSDQTPETSTEEQPEEALQPEPVDLAQYGVDPARYIDFEDLKQNTNEHIYSWITIPGTTIDYPVLQHPDEMDYYLDHNLDHSKGYPGVIYTQRMNKKDYTDPNTVIYGHNMNAGTMFAGLHQYENLNFFQENPYIIIYTEDDRVLVYEIFAAYEYTNAFLLNLFFMNTEEGVRGYFDHIFDMKGTINSNFKDDVELTTEDKIVTLSTCIRTKPKNRYLVQGVFICEGEQTRP